MKKTGFKKLTYSAVVAKKVDKSAMPNKNSGKVAKRLKSGMSMAKLKKELDRVFSLYVRSIYPKTCYTCGKAAERLQCGHYISRQYLVTRWDEHNCRPQCWGCNGYGKGQPLIFEENLKKEYGNDFVENMKASRHIMMKVDISWYKEQIEKYAQAIK